METIHVAAAVIENNNQILVAKRADIDGENAWEFPGGKVELAEGSEGALRREVREELGCELQLILPFDTIEFDYPDFHLSMDVFICTLAPKQEPEAKVHAELKWVSKDELTEVAWLAADQIAAYKLGMFWDMYFSEQHL